MLLITSATGIDSSRHLLLHSSNNINPRHCMLSSSCRRKLPNQRRWGHTGQPQSIGLGWVFICRSCVYPLPPCAHKRFSVHPSQLSCLTSLSERVFVTHSNTPSTMLIFLLNIADVSTVSSSHGSICNAWRDIVQAQS